MANNPAPGWYPDPSGRAGQFRWWDGAAWSAAVAPTPDGPPPPGAQTAGGQTVGGQAGAGSPASDPVADDTDRTPVGVWIGAAAAMLVLVLVIVFAVRTIGGEGPIGGGEPIGGPTQSEVCPTTDPLEQTPRPHPADGRVHGGALSFPRLDSPWGAVTSETRVPFGYDAYRQAVLTQANYQPGSNWEASITVAELNAGDGFFAPKDASEIVVKCIVGAFYGQNRVGRDDTVSERRDLDGHEGYYVESELSFDIRNLNTDGELLMVWIIQSSDFSASLYYASIPNNRRADLEPAARQSMDRLRVDG